MLVYSTASISLDGMRTMIVKVTIPDEVDPEDVFVNMTADFFYSNRHTEDLGPYIDDIQWEIVSVEEAVTQ